jgi:hypothetical protein
MKRQGVILLILLSALLVGAASATNSYVIEASYSCKYFNGYSQTWDTWHHDDESSHFLTGLSYYGPRIQTDPSPSGIYNSFSRAGLEFDTSVLPDDEYITSIELSLKGNEVYNQLYGAGAIAIVEWYNDRATTGYDGFDFTHALGLKGISAFSTGSYTNVSLFNTYTEGHINKTGKTYLGVLIYEDFTDEEYPFVGNKIQSLTYYGSGEVGSKPKLYITTSDINPITPTPTPTPYPGNISVNLLEKYSNAALVNQAITITPTSGGAGQTMTSLYGETLHFGVVPGMEYWFNASRAGYHDYNETYTIPASPGIYNVYMTRTLTPIADHSYAHFSVVDQTNGGLIPNAEIRLSDGQTKLTNSAGYAWFSVNNSEQINYYVSKPSGYWPAYGAMNLTADESILVALQRYTGPTATATMPGWTPVTVPTTGTGVDPVVTLSAQLRQQNVQEGMDVWYTNLPFISQFLFLLFIIGGLGLMAGGTRRN